MKIAIIGGGAIGLLFAHYLSQQHEITLYVRKSEQKTKVNSEGVTLRKKDHSYRVDVKAELISDWGLHEEELSIICVKQYQLQDLLKNASLPKDHQFLFLQNGMGHLKWIDQFGLENVWVGSVEHGAFRESEDTVVHTGEGCTKMALYKGENSDLPTLLGEYFQHVFPFLIEHDYKEMLQKKLVVNAIINPLTSILKVQNGALLDNLDFFRVFTDLFNEIKGILNIKEEQLYYENVIQVCRKTSQNRSSMLKDLEEKRPTEIDAILGYLIEEATMRKVEAPLITTLFHLIKGIEREEGGESDVRNLF
jgi:2-dehydropantoate 2-reductase